MDLVEEWALEDLKYQISNSTSDFFSFFIIYEVVADADLCDITWGIYATSAASADTITLFTGAEYSKDP